jgi:hypothetical protein
MIRKWVNFDKELREIELANAINGQMEEMIFTLD